MSDDRISERIRRQAAMASRAGQMAKLEDIAADVEALEDENANQAERIAIYQDTLTTRRDHEVERLRAELARLRVSARWVVGLYESRLATDDDLLNQLQAPMRALGAQLDVSGEAT